MRDADITQDSLPSTVQLENFVPLTEHPLRAMCKLFNEALDELDGLFAKESIALETLLHALLIRVFYSIRSERQLIE